MTQTARPDPDGRLPPGGPAATDEAGPASFRKVRTVMPIPCIATGVGLTCRSILHAAVRAGFPGDLLTTRYDPDPRCQIEVASVLPGVSRFLPYALLSGTALRLLQDRLLKSLADGEIVHLWPAAPLGLHEELHRRGIPIVAEAVNTRMEVAKPLLDAAYDAAGMRPGHGITRDRIENQNARYALCSAIMTPSPATEAALAGTPYADRFIPTSYGTWLPPALPPRRRKAPDEVVTFLFVGQICVRKGIPNLLAAWRDLPRNMRLRLVGQIESGFADRFREALSQDNVSVAEFTRDTRREYLAADVFLLPSIEEGDAIVTYEAAAHGLPVLASPAGAGRIGADSGAIRILDPWDAALWRQAMIDLALNGDQRAEAALQALSAVRRYDWSAVGPRSYRALHAALAQGAALTAVAG
ncbi:MAG: hypothetical protein RLZZ528_1160 [Pseudomonadota bacterium]|jgi:glycosyltransferase involved in cell wall biosynthesis